MQACLAPSGRRIFKLLWSNTHTAMKWQRASYVAFLQALCFMAGANSIFDGDKLLTTPNNDRSADMEMFAALGLRSRPAFLPYQAGAASSNGSDTRVAEAEQEGQAVAAMG